jgi:cytochrome c553
MTPRKHLLAACLTLMAMTLTGGGPVRGVIAYALSSEQPDSLQRSADIYYFRRIASSGPGRGEEIYFFKCWYCHSKYNVQAQYGDRAPYMVLDNLYKRPKLLNGQPVNDKTVSDWISKGGGAMPGYGSALTEQDLKDLASYLRERCCWDEEHVPRNPRYHPNP